MTNIDREALRDAVANRMPLGYNETSADPADVFEAADRILPLIAAAVDAARAEGDKQGAARVREAVERLAKHGVRGFDMNPTLPMGGRDTIWWLDYLRRYDDYWRRALVDALTEAAPE